MQKSWNLIKLQSYCTLRLTVQNSSNSLKSVYFKSLQTRLLQRPVNANAGLFVLPRRAIREEVVTADYCNLCVCVCAGTTAP